ncbi:MAG: single-stranded DNA-binding protein [Myxococcales bacterium]|nr:single-stranded DNA-binding protein [Myxococcales bacterium]
MLRTITDDLIADLHGQTFAPPVTHVYNPLLYARQAWDQYCDKYGQGQREVLFLGMNPGPWGMAQVGVPFGEIAAVRDWLGISAEIGTPEIEHPKRKVVGFDCKRSEVSGRRFWGWAQENYSTPGAFFERYFVANYCPLVFMEAGGRNRVPEKLPKAERAALFAACDRALRRTVEQLQPTYVVGVGKFAEKKAKQVVGDMGVTIGSVPHPSPASPLANRGWAPLMTNALTDMGII